MILSGQVNSTAMLAGNRDIEIPYDQIKALNRQSEETSDYYSKVFGISLNSSSSINAAELQFKISEEVQIGQLDFKMDDPALQAIFKRDGNELETVSSR